MRLWLLTVAVLSVSSIPALAADEFGARFGEDAPVALDDSATGLEDIAPAAGDEETDETKTPAVFEELLDGKSKRLAGSQAQYFSSSEMGLCYR